MFDYQFDDIYTWNVNTDILCFTSIDICVKRMCDGRHRNHVCVRTMCGEHPSNIRMCVSAPIYQFIYIISIPKISRAYFAYLLFEYKNSNTSITLYILIDFVLNYLQFLWPFQSFSHSKGHQLLVDNGLDLKYALEHLETEDTIGDEGSKVAAKESLMDFQANANVTFLGIGKLDFLNYDNLFANSN